MFANDKVNDEKSNNPTSIFFNLTISPTFTYILVSIIYLKNQERGQKEDTGPMNFLVILLSSDF